MIKDVLTRQNHWLLMNLNKLEDSLVQATIPPELVPYHTSVLAACRHLREDILRNIQDLQIPGEAIAEEILSNTQAATRTMNLMSTRLVYPILRASDADRLSLRVIGWMHREHPETQLLPPAFCDGATAVWPFQLPIYFLPCLDRQSVLFQPLLFHEFGHVLYTCHRREMDDLVRSLQQAIGQRILPSSSRNDRYASVQNDQRQAIVHVWYPWIQELFCDATGFLMGGPSFLHAFATHVRLLERSDLVQSPIDLGRGTHPVTWLRVKLLTERACAAGFPQEAQSISDEWEACAQALGIVEDYHGYYDSAIGKIVNQTVEDMLIEAAPRPYTAEEAAGGGWEKGTDTVIRLLNWAWQQYLESPRQYAAWEAEAKERYLEDSLAVVCGLGKGGDTLKEKDGGKPMTSRREIAKAPAPLEEYCEHFDPLFSRSNQRESFRQYLEGLLLPSERNKTLTGLVNTEPLVGAQLPRAQKLQGFLSESAWDERAVQAERLKLLREGVPGDPN